MFFSWGVSNSVQGFINTLSSIRLSIFRLDFFVNEVTIFFEREALIVIDGYFDLSGLNDEIGFGVELFKVGVFEDVLDFDSFFGVEF